MPGYDHLLVKQRDVLIGGRGFSLRPPFFPRRGRYYRVRSLTLREFLDLWTACLAAQESPRPEAALETLKAEFPVLLKASPRLFISETVHPRDRAAMTPEQAICTWIAFESVNDIAYLFGKLGAETSAPAGRRQRGPRIEGKPVGFIGALAGFLRAFPGYDLDRALAMPAAAFFGLIEAFGGQGDDEGRWKTLGPEERRDLMARLTKRLNEKREAAHE